MVNIHVYMGVSKNGGTPKWMVYFMENPIKMDDLGVPLLLETPIYHGKYSCGRYCHLGDSIPPEYNNKA